MSNIIDRNEYFEIREIGYRTYEIWTTDGQFCTSCPTLASARETARIEHKPPAPKPSGHNKWKLEGRP